MLLLSSGADERRMSDWAASFRFRQILLQKSATGWARHGLLEVVPQAQKHSQRAQVNANRLRWLRCAGVLAHAQGDRRAGDSVEDRQPHARKEHPRLLV
jgi:hypothetical protein